MKSLRTRLAPGQHVHLVGIGGSGLSAIARILLKRGYRVSGSDREMNALASALAQQGALIYEGHAAGHIAGADVLLISAAVSGENVEVQAARAAGIPIYRRADIIADVLAGHETIAVAGTHGKTTTTGMVVHVLRAAGQQPGFIVGGVLRNTGTNADTGAGRAFVIEADEYANMFHGLRPQVAVVTNVEYDHPDFFPTPRDFARAFSHFAGLLPGDGLLVACADDAGALRLARARRGARRAVVTYGFVSPQADWRGHELRVADDGGTAFSVMRGATRCGTVHLRLPGRHNALNALAALIVAGHQGVPFAEAAVALATFEGAGRRFDMRGEVGGVVVIDDYAHHPTAIIATLEALRQRYPAHALWAVWQPHTYSRTRALLDGFAGAFTHADHVLVTDIFAAREAPLTGLSGDVLAARIDHPDVHHVSGLQNAAASLDRDVRPPAVIVVLSAGDAPQIGVDLLERRRARQSSA